MLSLKRNTGRRRNYGRGLLQGGRKISDSLQGGGGTPGCLARRSTHRIIRSLAYPTATHQLTRPLVQGPHHSHHPALLPRRQLLVLWILLCPEPTMSHKISVPNRHHPYHPPRLHYPRHTADLTQQIFLRPKTRHNFLREARFIVPTSLVWIPSLPIHHPLHPLRVI